jgi:nitrous oxidase accessory protein NosD
VKKKTGNVLFGSKSGCAVMVTGRAKSRILYCSFSEAGVGVSIGGRAQVC